MTSKVLADAESAARSANMMYQDALVNLRAKVKRDPCGFVADALDVEKLFARKQAAERAVQMVAEALKEARS